MHFQNFELSKTERFENECNGIAEVSEVFAHNHFSFENNVTFQLKLHFMKNESHL